MRKNNLMGGSHIESMLYGGWGSDEAKKRKRIRLNSKVYFVRQGVDGPIKIGVSSRPEKRLITLQSANPETLFLLGTIRGDKNVETQLHQKFCRFLKRGEWYYPAPEFISEIREILKRGYI